MRWAVSFSSKPISNWATRSSYIALSREKTRLERSPARQTYEVLSFPLKQFLQEQKECHFLLGLPVRDRLPGPSSKLAKLSRAAFWKEESHSRSLTSCQLLCSALMHWSYRVAVFLLSGLTNWAHGTRLVYRLPDRNPRNAARSFLSLS